MTANQLTGLHDAAIKGNLNGVKNCIKAGADINEKNMNGSTALHYACHYGHVEVVKLLINNDADISATDNNNGRTALHSACRSGHVEVVEFLIIKNADISAIDKIEMTALHWASQRGHLEVVKFLLSNNANVSAANKDGSTALHEACGNGCTEVVKLLLANNANVLATNDLGKTPLQLARENYKDETVKYLESYLKQENSVAQKNRHLPKVKAPEYDNTVIYPQLEELEGELEQFKAKIQQVKRENQQRQQVFQEQQFTIQELQLNNNQLTAQIQDLQQNIAQLTAQIELRHPNDPDRSWMINKEEITIADKELGRGAYGRIKEGYFRGCKVAVKGIHDLIISDYNCHLFYREMTMAARCRHPNLLQFIGATSEGVPLIVTEIMHTSLRKKLERGEIFSEHIINISIGVACGLNYLHKTTPIPILHRDVSSANVLLNPLPSNQWLAKLSDFGSFNFMIKCQTVNPGNPVYAAPEATTGPHSPAMDVYSFGVLLHEMCSRKQPADRGVLKPALVRSVNWKAPESNLIPLISSSVEESIQKRPSMDHLLAKLNNLQ